jgi:hypothetical protein
MKPLTNNLIADFSNSLQLNETYNRKHFPTESWLFSKLKHCHSRRIRPREPFTPASSPFRRQSQVLTILVQILHNLAGMRPNRSVLPQDMINSAHVVIQNLVMVAAFHTALTTRNALTQLTYPPSLPDTSRYH